MTKASKLIWEEISILQQKILKTHIKINNLRFQIKILLNDAEYSYKELETQVYKFKFLKDKLKNCYYDK